MDFSPLQLHQVLEQVRARADRTDATGEWPAEDLLDLANIGASRWVVPQEFGGDEVSPLDVHKRYQAIASASLTVALILTQRDSAASIVTAATNWPQRSEVLKGLSRNEMFTTVGIAQLTTSRQRGAPALAATRVDREYVLNGEIPWATGANHAEFIIGGAVLEDRRQILLRSRWIFPACELRPHCRWLHCERVTRPMCSAKTFDFPMRRC